MVELYRKRVDYRYAPLTEFLKPPICSFCGRFMNEKAALGKGLEAHIYVEYTAEACSLLLRG